MFTLHMDIPTAVLLLIFSHRLATLYFDDEWAGITAAILVAFNWHIGWYTHRLLPDIAMTAFEVATLAYYLEYRRGGRRANLILCGYASTFALWTKESALYLLPRIITLLVFEEGSSLQRSCGSSWASSSGSLLSQRSLC